MNNRSVSKSTTLNDLPEGAAHPHKVFWPEQWSQAGGRALVRAVAMRAIVDREDVGGFWRQWLLDDMETDAQVRQTGRKGKVDKIA